MYPFLLNDLTGFLPVGGGSWGAPRISQTEVAGERQAAKKGEERSRPQKPSENAAYDWSLEAVQDRLLRLGREMNREVDALVALQGEADSTMERTA